MCPCKMGKLGHTQRKKMMQRCPRAPCTSQERLRPPDAGREAWTDSPQQRSGGACPAKTLGSDFQPQNFETIYSCCINCSVYGARLGEPSGSESGFPESGVLREQIPYNTQVILEWSKRQKLTEFWAIWEKSPRWPWEDGWQKCEC